MSKLFQILKRNAPLVLTGTSILCGAGACIFSASGALKAEKLKETEKPVTKKDKVFVYIRSYWPAGILFAGSTASSIFSHKISAKQIAGLTAACLAVEENFRKYRNVIAERLGEEEEKKIYISAKVDRDWGISPPLPSTLGDVDSCIFYDAYEERYFESTVEQVQQAMYHFNRNFCMRGWALLNEFYDMLGIPETDKGEVEGWSDVVFLEDYGMAPWVDFFTDIHEEDDGTVFYSIYSDIPPTVEAIERVFS